MEENFDPLDPEEEIGAPLTPEEALRKTIHILWESVMICDINQIDVILKSLKQADIPLTDTGLTGVHLGCSLGSQDVIQLFITHGASIEAQDSVGRRPLHYSCMNGYHHLTQYLIDLGCCIDCTSIGGETPLMKAILFNQFQNVIILIQSGANPHLQNERGQTAYDIAKMIKNPNMLKLCGAIYDA